MWVIEADVALWPKWNFADNMFYMSQSDHFETKNKVLSFSSPELGENQNCFLVMSEIKKSKFEAPEHFYLVNKLMGLNKTNLVNGHSIHLFTAISCEP